MAYNPKIDYSAEMKKYLAGGGKTSDAKYQGYQTSRDQKLFSMTPQQASKLGVSNDYNQLQKMMKDATSKITGLISMVPYGKAAANDINYAMNSLTQSGTPIIGGNATKVPEINPGYEALKSEVSGLKALLTGMQPQASTYTRPDYSGQINGSYDNLLTSQRAKLKANLQNQLSGFGVRKKQAEQQAIGALNTNDATMLQNLQRLYNTNEAGGQYGDTGANVSGKVQLGAVQGQNANAIRQDRDSYIKNLDTEANTLQSTAADNEIAAINEIEAKRLQDLQRAREYADNMEFQNKQFEYGISQDDRNRLDQLSQLNSQNSQWQQSFDADQKWRQYEANQAQRESEWARSESNPALRAQILANQMTELELQNLPEQQRLQLQQLRRQINQIGAVPYVDAVTKERQRVELEQAKVQLNQMKNPATTLGASDYKTNSDFADEIAGIYKNPNIALSKIQSNAAALIKKYGVDGYNELIAATTSTSTPNVPDWFKYKPGN